MTPDRPSQTILERWKDGVRSLRGIALRRRRWLAAALAVVIALGGAAAWQRVEAKRAARELVAAHFPGWAGDRFGRGGVRAESRALSIRALLPPGGVRFRRELDPARRYRIGLRGRRVSGSTTLRFRADEGEPFWTPAPTGEAGFVVPPGAHRLEMIIYSDGVFRYDLAALELAPAPTSATGEAWAGAAPPDFDTPGDPSLLAGWETDLYARPDVGRSGANLRIAADVAPAGVFFRRDIPSDRRYRLVLNGRPVETQPSLRFRVDGGPYVWTAVQDGRASVVLPRGSRLEALLYADRPFDYELRSLTVTPCETCVSEDQLKALITREAHLSPTDTPLQRARKLRNWVANAAVLGSEPQVIDVVNEAAAAEPPADVYSDYFAPRRGGVSPRGMAAFLTRIYQLFGMEAFWIDIGYRGTSLTHVTTVLAIGEGQNAKFYIFDPLLAGAYVRGGSLVDLDSVLGNIATARFETDRVTRTLLVPKSQARVFLRTNVMANTGAICNHESAVPYTLECRGFHHNVAYNRLMMQTAMAQNGFPPDRDFILGLLSQGLLAIGPPDVSPATRGAFLRVLDRHGVRHSSNS